MADLAPNLFACRRVVLGATYVPVTPPLECGQIVVENTDAANTVQIRSDKDDTSTEKKLAATLEFTLRTTPGNQAAFQKGVPVFWLASASGATVVITFLR